MGDEKTGQELLPLTVWLCPDRPEEETAGGTSCVRHRGTVGVELARHLLNVCTGTGGVVVDAFAGGEAVTAASVRAGRRAVACVPHFPLAQRIQERLARTLTDEERDRVLLRPCLPDHLHQGLADLAGEVDLVIGAPPVVGLGGGPSGGRRDPGCAACRWDVRTLDTARLHGFLDSAARVLKPGGHVAVVTTARYAQGRLFDPAPRIVRNARRAGLRYVQHAIAIRVPVDGDVLVVQAGPDDLAQLRDPRETVLPPVVSLHADVCLFTKPRGGVDE
ncbi:hypothetical protein [Actinocorallia sp. A-T 12471]|uniref:hypothetical protein n=1 Tax=Actinocorallia sp. A-T 12471 TaxID=3089813 RepID=UPI0029D4017F|nr:hypothetical protein [Actinocorallia sp. A-T 12471]MDX6738144.1 hypothetical protein [Actinocorallia sp. A-T 12471]